MQENQQESNTQGSGESQRIAYLAERQARQEKPVMPQTPYDKIQIKMSTLNWIIRILCLLLAALVLFLFRAGS